MKIFLDLAFHSALLSTLEILLSLENSLEYFLENCCFIKVFLSSVNDLSDFSIFFIPKYYTVLINRALLILTINIYLIYLPVT